MRPLMDIEISDLYVFGASVGQYDDIELVERNGAPKLQRPIIDAVPWPDINDQADVVE